MKNSPLQSNNFDVAADLKKLYLYADCLNDTYFISGITVDQIEPLKNRFYKPEEISGVIKYSKHLIKIILKRSYNSMVEAYNSSFDKEKESFANIVNELANNDILFYYIYYNNTEKNLGPLIDKLAKKEINLSQILLLFKFIDLYFDYTKKKIADLKIYPVEKFNESEKKIFELSATTLCKLVVNSIDIITWFSKESREEKLVYQKTIDELLANKGLAVKLFRKYMGDSILIHFTYKNKPTSS